MRNPADAPIYERLIDYHNKNRISFAMPGHKNGRGLADGLAVCDVTELRATVDLHGESEAVKRANELLSKAYGSDESRIVTEGSSAAIHAMIAAALNPGETLLASDDCHMSVVNTCALCGFNLRLFSKKDNIKDVLNKHGDIKAVIVTSPDYYGVCRDIAALAAVCHEYCIPLLADEAHGAHFPASKRFPKGALKSGADIVCQSAHKTLNALTGAAYLHVRGGIADRDRLWRALKMFSSTSPSYPIAASADIARAELSESQTWDDLFYICENFKKDIKSQTNIDFLENDDFSRIVLDFSYYDISGFEIDNILSGDYGIDAEMSDNERVVLIASPSNTGEDFLRLEKALFEITKKLKICKERFFHDMPPVSGGLIEPHKAFYSRNEAVMLKDCEKRMSCGAVTIYPPGVPVIYPGEIITREQIEYIISAVEKGAKITGDKNGYIRCVI